MGIKWIVSTVKRTWSFRYTCISNFSSTAIVITTIRSRMYKALRILDCKINEICKKSYLLEKWNKELETKLSEMVCMAAKNKNNKNNCSARLFHISEADFISLLSGRYYNKLYSSAAIAYLNQPSRWPVMQFKSLFSPSNWQNLHLWLIVKTIGEVESLPSKWICGWGV